ncbi:TetR/AcrR family transcriptional regulator [Paenibacillus sp. VCA1]|uniref:TetR/AcrR family transcriptional regulator n=1 Tax=Paenibacillus sp. VCA1 TaxID=3039148 RepID=UPI002871AC51|nr:TetR/AcrR family transcriptional regulator [Paenibacillus sp. VCA1]MDR9854886.1 TetR/AcrR family transcriptional regulator [Paenibacillus sp. VCA1]
MAGKTNSRESIVETASRLFSTQGYHGTGLNQIIKESHCPKGSLYYYFPEGKEELARECIEQIKRKVSGKWEEAFDRYASPAKAIQHHIEMMAEDAEHSNFEGFTPLSFWNAVETSSVSLSLREACQAAIDEWRMLVTRRLQSAGLDTRRAEETATVVLSMLEGSLIIAMTNRDTGPIRIASKYMGILVERVLQDGATEKIEIIEKDNNK